MTGAAVADTRKVAEIAGNEPSEVRAALFAAVPLIVGDYADGAAALALDWYEELRDEAPVDGPFTPQPFTVVTDEDVAAMVARTTESLHDLEIEVARIAEDFERELAASLDALTSAIQQEVADAFRETIIENTKADPESAGWKRFARPEACGFCRMLAARGAVYTKETARFAAHGAFTNGKRTGGDCMCIAGPEFGGKETWAEATPMQYVASKRKRTEAERAALRKYLNKNYPDTPR